MECFICQKRLEDGIVKKGKIYCTDCLTDLKTEKVLWTCTTDCSGTFRISQYDNVEKYSCFVSSSGSTRKKL
jgi:hypothetical protein